MLYAVRKCLPVCCVCFNVVLFLLVNCSFLIVMSLRPNESEYGLVSVLVPIPNRPSSREKGSSWHQYGWTAWLGVTSQTIIRYSTEMVSSWNASRTAIRLRSYSYIEWNVSYVNKMKHYYYHLKRNGIRKTLNLFISWGKVRTGLPANPTSQSIFVLFVSQGR